MPSSEAITWLASYPKSGNTWTRAFLANYLGRAEAGPADINELHGEPIASDRMLFDEVVGVEAACLLPGEVLALRPQVYRFLARRAAEAGKPIFIKAHDAWQRLPSGEALFPAEATRAVIYIVRNPLDVAVSLAHHSGLTFEQAAARLCDAAYALVDAPGDMAQQLPQFLGSWSHHVQSWLDDSGLPVHLMRYEDMLADPEAAFGAMLRFAGLDCDPRRLDSAVRAAAFEALQQQEAERGFRERRQAATARFFRQGRAGGWRQALPPELAQRLLQAHREALRRLGYLDANGELVV
jgi:hypothetical protein